MILSLGLAILLVAGASTETINLGNGNNDLRVTVIESNPSHTIVRFDIGSFSRNAVDINGRTYYSIGSPDQSTMLNAGNSALLVSSGPLWVCGDVDNNGSGPDVADLTFLVDYLFNAGPTPVEPAACDVDGSTSVDVADLTFLVDYLFNSDPPPTCGR